jgi:hypothetical protein
VIRSTTRLRSINPVQLGIVLGVIYGVFGLIAGLIIAMMGSITTPLSPSYFIVGHVGYFAIVAFPVGYFVAGFIGGIIVAALYNLVAGWTGGIEFTFEQPG